MTTVEKKIELLVREVRVLKERVERLVPLDDEGTHSSAYLKKLDRAHASKVRHSFKSGRFSRA